MTHATRTAFIQGCQSALPIALGYIPVAIAFGMATTSAGFPTWVIVAMSVFIYAGASQFLLFASIMSGASVLAVVGLCALLDSRHLLYAPLMKRHLKSSDGVIWVAPLITMKYLLLPWQSFKTLNIKSRGLWVWRWCRGCRGGAVRLWGFMAVSCLAIIQP